MALIGVQPTTRQRGPSTLEKISLGIDIASKVLGIGFAAKEAKQADETNKLRRIQTEMDVLKDFDPVPTEEKTFPGMSNFKISGTETEPPGSFKIGGLAGRYKLRADKSGDLDRSLLSSYSQDYKIVPSETPKSLKVNISGKDFFFEPKDEKTDDETFNREVKLRQEFLNQSKEFIEQTSSYGRIVESAKDPSAAGDLALVFNYMKILDPGSTVREGEQALARNAAGIPERIRTVYNRVLSGENLGAHQRADFVDRAKRLYSSASSIHGEREKFYLNLANERDLDPVGVVPKLGFPTEKEKTKLMTPDEKMSRLEFLRRKKAE